MEKVNISDTITKFINIMGYLDDEHVLGCFFYGSFLTGYNNKYSDLDLHIIYDDEEPDRLIRGNTIVDGIRVEYFEKPISDMYESIDNDFNNQNSALFAIVGRARIIFDKHGDLHELKEYAIDKFSKPLPKLDEETSKEYVSIINNRMEKLKIAFENNDQQFIHLYHLTIEKIRKFYHKLNGITQIATSKVFRVYTDEAYGDLLCRGNLPDEEFRRLYLDAALDTTSDISTKYQKVVDLWNHSKRNVEFDENNYRILIKSRNKMPKPDFND